MSCTLALSRRKGGCWDLFDGAALARLGALSGMAKKEGG